MVRVREERVEGIQVILVEAPKSITQDYIESRKVCVHDVEAKLAINVDAWKCFHISYSAWVKVICTVSLTGGVDILEGVKLGVVEENIAWAHSSFPNSFQDFSEVWVILAQ